MSRTPNGGDCEPVPDFTRAIRQLLEDENLRMKMGAAARVSVQDRSWPNAFRKFWEMTNIT